MKDLLELIAARTNIFGSDPAAGFAIAKAGWRRIAGETLARYSRPEAMLDGKLRVSVADVMWERQIKVHRDEIIFKINSLCRTQFVQSIEFVVSPEDFSSAVNMQTPETSGRGELPESLLRAADKISDHSLREQFLAAARAAK